MPGLIVDDTLNVDDQHKYRSNDLGTTFNLSNQIQERLDNVLTLMKERTNSVNFMIQKPIEEISNDPLSYEKGYIKAEDFYIDDNYSNLLGNIRFFPQSSADDKKDFQVNIASNELIVYKSPTLTTVNITKKDFKNSLNNIVEDLNANIVDFDLTHLDRKRTIKKFKK